jgi:hypothetical protein
MGDAVMEEGFATGDDDRASVRASDHVQKRTGHPHVRWLAEGFNV